MRKVGGRKFNGWRARASNRTACLHSARCVSKFEHLDLYIQETVGEVLIMSRLKIASQDSRVEKSQLASSSSSVASVASRFSPKCLNPIYFPIVLVILDRKHRTNRYLAYNRAMCHLLVESGLLQSSSNFRSCRPASN